MKKVLPFILAIAIQNSWAECPPSVFILHEIPLLPTVPERYIVTAQDTWMDVISKFVVDPSLFQIKNPKIRAGDVVHLITRNKRPALQIKRGRNVKLCPTIYIFKEKREVPTIPTASLQQFLNRPKIVTEEEMQSAGYIVGNANQSLLAVAGNFVYAEGLDNLSDERHYIVVRLGQAFHSRNSDEVLAYEAIYLADAELQTFGDSDINESATLKLTSVQREIHVGDRLLLLGERKFNEDFHPHAPDPESLANAQIIAVVDGVSQIGQYQVVVINKGLNDDIEKGHILVAHKRRRQIKSKFGQNEKIILPRRRAGTLMVFKSFELVSYALVMKAVLSISLFDEVTAP